MRIIAGTAKGRRLKTAPGRELRPTADKVRGAIFSIVGSRFDLAGARILDLFAGSGALGLEALSRGAGQVTFVEQSSAAARIIEHNLDLCGFASAARIIRLPVARALTRLAAETARFDGILLDPPYGEGRVAETLAALERLPLLHPGGWLLIEHHSDEAVAAAAGKFQLTQARRYGKTALALLTTAEESTRKMGKQHAIRAVYAGSFDPITNGHLDVLRRALNVFDEVIVAVADTTSDAGKGSFLFTAAERVEMIREVVADTDGRASADSFTGLLVDYCEQVGARVSIRGLRAVSDFEYEFQMAMMNRHIKPQIETVFMASSQAHFYTSSRLVKEVARLGGDVAGLLPDTVFKRLMNRLGRA